jgi:hypothetical protein
MNKDSVILPKGTVVKLNGFPCELVADTEVVSGLIAREGLDWVNDQRLSLSQVEHSPVKPFQAASPDSLATSNSSPLSR